MTTRWLTVFALSCIATGFLQTHSDAFWGLFYVSLGALFGGLIEMHRRTLRRVEELEKALEQRAAALSE